MTNIQSTLTHHETIDGQKYHKIMKTVPVGNQFLTTITVVKDPLRPLGIVYRGDVKDTPELAVEDTEKLLATKAL